MTRIRLKLAGFRRDLKDLLDRDAKVKDLVKASLPLWIFTVAACGAGFVAITVERTESCRRGREDIAEFVDRTIKLNPNPDPARVAVIDKLVDDFVADCGLR